MGEFLDFIKVLEPVWEDTHEFDWLRPQNMKNSEEERNNPFKLNRFPGLKMIMESK